VYGNRTKNEIIFKEELAALKDKFIDRFSIYHVLSREFTDAPLNSGRLDADKCELLFSNLIDIKNVDEFFLCGPEEMIFCIKNLLTKNGVSKDHIHFELFTVPGEKENKEKVEHKQATTYKGKRAEIKVRLDGITFTFGLGYDEESILDAALDQGADLPYACKGGVCTTCKAKLVTGQVEMENNWGLDDEEVEAGFILTCQSHPITSEIFVDFDAR
jgi:ring-1,2-phenylacetyl-CoA epoxidase subunit PaaE